MTNNFLVRFATKEDVEKCYPEGSQLTLKAWVLEQNKKLLAIGGVIICKGKYTAFIKLMDKVPPKTFWKASKEKTKEVLNFGFPIAAIKDNNIENSQRYLTKLGFKFSYLKEDKEVYILCNH